MNSDLDNLIALHGWEINRQNFLDIKGTEYTLSVIPEYSFYMRDKHGKIYRTQTPQSLLLNTCIYNRITGATQMYFTFDSEEEFLDFMAGIQKQCKLEKQIQWEN